MQNPFPYIIRDNTFWVSSERCLYWEERNTLVVTDLHLGKAGHFRKSGIAIPQDVYKADLQRLMAQLYFFKADRLIIVGDFTHSTANKELELFKKWRNDFSLLQIELVKGNHDILEDEWYSESRISVRVGQWMFSDFLFIHEVSHHFPAANGELTSPKKSAGTNYIFSGHVHPCIIMKGRGKQSLRLPCFYFTRDHCILPAFSKFTGTYIVEPRKGEIIFAIAEKRLIQIS